VDRLRGGGGGDHAQLTTSFFCSHTSSLFCKGTQTPGFAHSATLEAEDLICWSSPAEGRKLVPFDLSFFGHISLRDERHCLEIEIK
jgi:hypothetical protein